ncbi:hypothetical protein DPMN_068502 [Dreissena polymorpha]|uniref:Uncharacterized protein n=1 Tax=Dreissena polymorpha TaxID=45954 RepID=A0A9D3YZB0_DREPO|nr:hypothetical protein DPMN_068502 [Dreissena polymorpha]
MGNSGTVAPLIEEFRHSGSPEWEIQAQWQPCLGNSGTVAVLIGEFRHSGSPEWEIQAQWHP